MKHDFTDQQIIDALEDAELAGDWEAFRSFLDALPEPQDDWQQCTIDQVRKGDRVRWQDPGMDDICTYEIIASHTEAECPGWILFSRTESYYFPSGAVVDRLPAPVQHPDPAEHQYILVHRADPKYNRHMFPNVGMTSGKNGYGVGKIYISAEHILEWEELTPAKVVADDD